MTEETGWRARVGALLSGKLIATMDGPWGKGGGGSSGGGSGGDGGGKGPRNPWQQPPGGGKPRGPRGPSALDELARRLQDQFGGDGGNPWPAIKIGLLIFGALWLLFTSVWRVSPQERAVVTRFVPIHAHSTQVLASPCHGRSSKSARLT